MKNFTTKKFFTFILLLSGMFSFTFANAQTCNGSKVWTCRTCIGPFGTTYQECDCVNPDKVDEWQATPCGEVPLKNYDKGHNGNGHNDGGACICRIGNNGVAESSQSIYPNLISGSATIYFTLSTPQKISLRTFDVNGSLITTLVDGEFSAGEHQVQWDATEVKAGIYVLKLFTSDYSTTQKLIVIR